LSSAVAGLKSNGIKSRKINVMSNRHQAEKYKIRVVPTFVYEVNGQEKRRKTGALSKTALKKMCR
jgi:hypothetical protein